MQPGGHGLWSWEIPEGRFAGGRRQETMTRFIQRRRRKAEEEERGERREERRGETYPQSPRLGMATWLRLGRMDVVTSSGQMMDDDEGHIFSFMHRLDVKGSRKTGCVLVGLPSLYIPTHPIWTVPS